MVSKLRRLATGVAGVAVVGSMAASTALAAAPTRVVAGDPHQHHVPGRDALPVRGRPDGRRHARHDDLHRSRRPDEATSSYKDGKIGYLNPANGKTLMAVLAGPAVEIDNGDGTTTLRVPGNDQRYTAPGLGFIVGNTGLAILTLDNATGEVLSVDKLAGHQDGTPFPALCVGLE